MSVQSDHMAPIFCLSLVKPKRVVKSVSLRRWKDINKDADVCDVEASELYADFSLDADEAMHTYNNHRTKLSINLQLYKSQRTREHSFRQKAKWNYYVTKCSATSSQKEFHRVINKLLHKDGKVSPLPSKYPENDLPDIFAAYFCEKMFNSETLSQKKM